MLAYRNNVFLVPASVVKQDKVVFLRVPTGVSKQELKKKNQCLLVLEIRNKVGVGFSVPTGVGKQKYRAFFSAC